MKARILVVDDEALMREYVEEALLRSGHEVASASGGREAMALVKEKSFDIVVTDLKMSPVDGLAVLRAVREESPDTHCIVMTAYGTIESAVEAMPRDPYYLFAKIEIGLDQETFQGATSRIPECRRYPDLIYPKTRWVG
jgi:two-component system response regulator AtoC